MATRSTLSIHSTYDFVVAIPSYKRHKLLVEKTLAYLKGKLDWSMIYVFIVDDPDEITNYTTILQPNNKDTTHMYTGIHIVRGPLGLHNMRNFITEFFDTGVCILNLDDDIENVMSLWVDDTVHDIKKASRYKLVNMDSFVDWTVKAFAMLKDQGLYIFGIYPVKNGYFMKDLPEITNDLRFCVGTLWGCINRKSMPRLTLEEKEDFERTLLYWKRDGSVVRFNHITIVTKYYKTPGGMQSRSIDRAEAARKACTYLCYNFPRECKLYLGKKSGIPEVRLKGMRNDNI